VTLLSPNQGIRFASHQQSVTSPKVDGQSLHIGGWLVWRVELTDGRMPVANLHVECHAGEDTWWVAVPIEDDIGPTE